MRGRGYTSRLPYLVHSESNGLWPNPKHNVQLQNIGEMSTVDTALTRRLPKHSLTWVILQLYILS